MIPDTLLSTLESSGKVIVLGLGSEIRGDEGAPMNIVEGLKENDRIQPIWAGTRPENFTKKIIEYKPDHILVLMVSSFGGEPGESMVVKIDEHEEVSLHESPLTTMTHYLKEQISTEITLLMIEPQEPDDRGYLRRDCYGFKEDS